MGSADGETGLVGDCSPSGDATDKVCNCCDTSDTDAAGAEALQLLLIGETSGSLLLMSSADRSR